MPARRLWVVVPAGLVALMVFALLAACDNDADGADDDRNTEGIDRQAILNDPDEVRALLDTVASQFAGEVISDAEYDGDQLTVAVTQDAEAMQEAEALCHDLSEAIAATDLGIQVTDENGAVLASCRFEG